MIINFELVKHPMNWVTIMLMLIIAGAFGHLVLSYAGIEPKSTYTDVPAGLAPADVSYGAIAGTAEITGIPAS